MPDELDPKAADYVTSLAKASLGAVPFAGSLLAELPGTVIPKQRIDRIADFARHLEQQIHALNQSSVRARLKDENFTDLLEEATRHAARAVTEERRAYLASLMASGISEERVSFIESKHLLRILGEINDIEVIWLRFYLLPQLDGDHEFREKHAAVLEPVAAHLGSDQPTIDRQALQRNYLQHLESLGLLEQPLQIDLRTKQPSVDTFTKDWKRQGHRVTTLGRLLLRHIGLYVSGNDA